MTQHIQETCRGLRVTVDPKMPTELELEVIVKLVDSLIDERIPHEGATISDFTAHLMSARSHLLRAMREVA